MEYIKMLYPILGNAVLVALVYLIDKHTPLKKLPYMAKQIIIGIFFGGMAAFGSEYGFEVLGTVANMRDAAPLSAGLIFGAPAGIISGIIGGLYRWFSVYWGAGTYTRVACTIATILAGFLAAVLRKLMFDNKKPTAGYGVFITVVCEVVHMLLIFITNMKDSAYAFEFVKGATIPMILGNSITVGISIIIVSLLSGEKKSGKKYGKNISGTFQRWLLVCILVAYLLTGTFSFVLQNGMVQIETREIFTTAISDVTADVRGKSDDYLVEIAKNIAADYTADPDVSMQELAKKHDVIEINIVDKNGIIIRSTSEEYENTFDMKSTEQSNEFMVLTQGQKTYVQQYGPVGSDGKTMRKFAGVALEDGGFVQAGYSSEQFHEMLDVFVTDVTKNRHVGSGGFVAVCDEELNLITQNSRNGNHISSIGIFPNEQMLNGEHAESLCDATITNAENGYEEEFVYAFTFAEGYCIIAAMPRAEVMFMRDASMYTSMFMLVLIFAALFVFIYFLIKKVIINNLRKINGSLAEITDGNLDVTVDVRSNEEFASLSDDINSTVSTLKRYIAEAAARIDKELEYAKQIQLSALPCAFPDNEDYGIFAQMTAAKEVGGDFYDFYRLDDKRTAFLVADVSGKGIPAAMFMMRAKTILKDLADGGKSVDEIFTRANEELCENNESGMFVTAWMGIFDSGTGVLSFANAGHNPPLLMRKNGDFEYLKTRAGFVLAGLEGVKYRSNETALSEGDRIFLYTDGVTEATNTSLALYGEDRLLDYMNKNKSTDAEALLNGLKADIDTFAGDAPQFDDITMLIFDCKPQEEKLFTSEKIFPAKTDKLPEVLGYIEGILEGFECSLKIMMSVSVAVEEIFVNVANYAYGDGEGDVKFTLTFEEKSRLLTLEMSDKGKPFDPLSLPEPDVTLSAEEREIGGLGIFITKKTMDTVSYRYENGENVLTIGKKI